MRKITELELIGEQLSKDYIEKNMDLTTNLKKVANNLNFNKQQIKRIAETANVETYLKLANLSENGYVEFELADADKVASDLDVNFSKSANNTTNEWLDLLPKEYAKAEQLLFGQEKTASDNSVISFNDLSVKLAEIKNDEREVTANYYELMDVYNKLEALIKQATAEGNEIADVKEIIKVASPDYSELIIDTITKNLKDKLPTQDFTKVAEINETLEINDESELFNTIKTYEKIADSMNENTEQLLDKKLNLVKEIENTEYKYYIKEALAKTKFLESLSNLNPFKTRLRTGLTATAIALPVGVSLGKDEEKYKQQFRNANGQVRS
ncbi:hypothetical protein KC678_05640 [Candidatus Dojkabacteria bacterium]|uniref:Uncharacterized protein n=1 Tax=Candidatus Dojkabacteria bacterium TaxID=2099670 RepID=A0A955L2K3_9BACT|nr:hypothetical protein [Candidatus Dojkabacteria bacterium]